LEKDEILIRNLYMSLDPYMRGRMRSVEGKSYSKPFVIGNVLEAGGIGVVVNSNNDQWKKGDIFLGLIGK